MERAARSAECRTVNDDGTPMSGVGRDAVRGRSMPRRMSAAALRLVMVGLAVVLAACGAGGAPAPGPGAPPLGPAAAPPKAAAAPSGAALPPALQAVVDGARREGSLQLVWSQSTLAGSEGARE